MLCFPLETEGEQQLQTQTRLGKKDGAGEYVLKYLYFYMPHSLRHVIHNQLTISIGSSIPFKLKQKKNSASIPEKHKDNKANHLSRDTKSYSLNPFLTNASRTDMLMCCA